MKANLEITIKFNCNTSIESFENLKALDSVANQIGNIVCDELTDWGCVTTYDVLEKQVNVVNK